MRRAWLIVLVAACGALFKPKRSKPPDTWSLQAAVIHSMMTAPPAFTSATPDCNEAPMPDLKFFCEKKCDSIGELSLKAYCAWDCDEVKNPDLGVICKLEAKQSKTAPRPEDCDAIYQAKLQAHCKQWVASLPKKR